jgi:hypothetical protein
MNLNVLFEQNLIIRLSGVVGKRSVPAAWRRFFKPIHPLYTLVGGVAGDKKG